MTKEKLDGDAFKMQVLRLGLKKLLKSDSHFSVCALRELATLSGVMIEGDEMAMYNVLHCMDYCDMNPEFRDALHHRVMSLFLKEPELLHLGKTIDNVFTPTTTEPELGWWKKMIFLK